MIAMREQMLWCWPPIGLKNVSIGLLFFELSADDGLHLVHVAVFGDVGFLRNFHESTPIAPTEPRSTTCTFDLRSGALRTPRIRVPALFRSEAAHGQHR